MKKYLIPVTLALVLSECTGTGKTMVLNAPTERRMARTYKLVAGNSTVGCDEAVIRQFEAELRSLLSEANMAPGNDLFIEYRFIQFDEGSRFVRYLSGGVGNAGEGELTLEVVFKNGAGRELAKMHVGGKITAGFFGGSFDNAVEQAANQVAKFVITNFKK